MYECIDMLNKRVQIFILSEHTNNILYGVYFWKKNVLHMTCTETETGEQ